MPNIHMTDAIRYENVSKHFGNLVAVDEVSFGVKQGELLALLGPSGSGKTTTLRMLAGFERPTEGLIKLKGRDVTSMPPHKRDTGMVFQDYALFPHMTVAENIAFGLERKGRQDADIQDRITEVLEMVDLGGFRDRRPSNLSGGQQQRVATARAIAIEPEVLLMDEPLGALDKKLRDQLQIELVELQQKLNITTLYVTHNQEEALTMADRVVVMNEGHIEQIAQPDEIYEQPATRFVADFIGDTNFLEGEFVEQNGHIGFLLGNQEVTVSTTTLPSNDASVFVRPEKIQILDPDAAAPLDNVVSGNVNRALFLGSKIRYFVEIEGQELVVEMENQPRNSVFSSGDDVRLTWSRYDTQVAS